ncbi:hypothetical protein SAMN05660657_05071 [Geodermatophilus amargosae]|uniref:Uncharacterized protein n=1 Tax=Geodermatophilus amargosae TaxID=1296565 RepID=A0A1I7CZ96_9ACTN|nr:hypothetical protein [Geodermatophilus amargosae]SFU04733.1 hypothetical protein SAMN05660657_05071 [Geodermatophilus amargosae]
MTFESVVPCPRCGLPPGDTPPGVSRMTNEPLPPLWICTDCCADEADTDTYGDPPWPPTEWAHPPLGWT